MRAVILSLALACCAGEFDMYDYISESCVGGTDYTVYIDSLCPVYVVEEIVDGIDKANNSLDSNIQVCGMTGNTVDVDLISCDLSTPDGKEYIVGHHKSGDITLYITRVRGLIHLRKVILHEIGHYLGGNNNHSNSKKDVMYPLYTPVTEYTEHDKTLIMH